MRVLFLAPEPFYQDRGTPIAIDRLLRVLTARGNQVDLLTYHEGQDVTYDGLKIHRTPALPFLRHIRPGLSPQKLVCDALLLFKAVGLARRTRYDVVHAVEEAVFVAVLLRTLFGLRYVYDMDSSLGEQMVERFAFLRPLVPLFDRFEGLAAKRAVAVVPVCDALAQTVAKHGPRRVMVLQDPSLLAPTAPGAVSNLKEALGIKGPLLMYVGNLKAYQGIDLLLHAFAAALPEAEADLAIIGGQPSDVAVYRRRAAALGIAARVHFLGPKPVGDLGGYLAQADILVSPRISGNNTPMKIYSYLDSGKPVIATALPTHTQVLDEAVALLVPPTPEAFAEGIARLVNDAPLRRRLGLAARQLAEEQFSLQAYQAKANALVDWLSAEVGQAVATAPERGEGRAA
jgi:glycosyltransferase involved in cell wall biosynthesis